MDKIIDKINKLSLPATILIASIIFVGIFYASEEERKKEDQVIQKQEQAKQEQDKPKLALNTCITIAETNYSDHWYRECESEGKLTDKDKCISLYAMTFDEYAKQNNIPSPQDNLDKRLKAMDDFYKQRADCSCRLPLDNADRINKILQDDKNECFKKYPQK